jgi:hypothetical protein
MEERLGGKGEIAVSRVGGEGEAGGARGSADDPAYGRLRGVEDAAAWPEPLESGGARGAEGGFEAARLGRERARESSEKRSRYTIEDAAGVSATFSISRTLSPSWRRPGRSTASSRRSVLPSQLASATREPFTERRTWWSGEASKSVAPCSHTLSTAGSDEAARRLREKV